MTTVGGIHGQILDITVLGCNKLKNTERFTKQDPYICFEYSNMKHRTKTCTDGGKNPIYNEKIQITLVEGVREMTITVWNSNAFMKDDFIGSGRVQLDRVLMQGYDDSTWTIQTKTSQYAGDVKLIMHFGSQLLRRSNSSYSQIPPPQQPAYYAPPPAPYPYPPPCPGPSNYPATASVVQQTYYPSPVHPTMPYQQQHPPSNN